MPEKEDRKVKKILEETTGTIRRHLEKTAKSPEQIRSNRPVSGQNSLNNLGEKITDTTKDMGAVLKENAENVATLLGLMLVM